VIETSVKHRIKPEPWPVQDNKSPLTGHRDYTLSRRDHNPVLIILKGEINKVHQILMGDIIVRNDYDPIPVRKTLKGILYVHRVYKIKVKVPVFNISEAGGIT
jgi:hypothetical protein